MSQNVTTITFRGLEITKYGNLKVVLETPPLKTKIPTWSKNYAFKAFRDVLSTVDVKSMFLEMKAKVSTPESTTADLTRSNA